MCSTGCAATMARVVPLEVFNEDEEVLKEHSSGSLGPPEERNKEGSDSEPIKTPHRPSEASQALSTSGEMNLMRQITEKLAKTRWFETERAICVRKFLRGPSFTIFAMVLVLLALFLSELFSCAQVPTNVIQDVILQIVMVFFLVEWCTLVACDRSYFMSFFFFMDLIGTISMGFDISYMFGTDVSQPQRVESSGSSQNVIVVRAARAAKLGARAGRLGRLLKLMKFMPFMDQSNKTKIKTARIISAQLTNVLSTRVSFLTIAVAVILPVFTLFLYPENDYSLGVWPDLLERNAEAFDASLRIGSTAQIAASRSAFVREVASFSSFFGSNYGPFQICYGSKVDAVTFNCQPQFVNLTLSSSFSKPVRPSNILQVILPKVQVSFDLSATTVMQSASSIGLMLFIIVVMIAFGMLTSSAITVIAIYPLERMLQVVRDRCKQIFMYTSELQEDEDDGSEDEDFEDDAFDGDHISEFGLLEKVVAKLAAIAHLTSMNQPPEAKANMTENEIMALNWMQGNAHGTPMGSAPSTPMSQKAMVSSKGFQRGSLLTASNDVDIVEVLPGLDTLHEDSEHDDDVEEVPRRVSSKMRNSLAARSDISHDLIETLHSDMFDALSLSQELKISVTAYIIQSNIFCDNWVRTNVPETTLLNFITAVEGKYLPKPFHNYSHGLDVCNTVCRSLRLSNSTEFTTEVTQFWMLIAAIGHDLGHTAVNNQFLIDSGHELALMYNDRSPMENMHCALLFQIAAGDNTNVFQQVEKSVYQEMRTGIIAAILHTDMTKHNDMIKELSLLYQMNSEAFDLLQAASVVSASFSNLRLILNAVLHISDINNPMKPWFLCDRLATLALEEFFAQGDQEAAMGMPVQMLNDRNKVNKPNSQVGFIEFVILPLCEVMVNMLPQLDEMADHLSQNLNQWCSIWIDESNPAPDAASKVQARVQKAATRCKAVMRSSKGLVGD